MAVTHQIQTNNPWILIANQTAGSLFINIKSEESELHF